MGSIFLFVAILALIKLVVEESQRHSLWLRLTHALLFALFMLLIHPYTLTISRLWVDRELNSTFRLNDATLVVLLDLLFVLLAMTAREVRWPNRRRFRYYGVLPIVGQLMHKLVYFLPPLLAFPALFYLRVVLLFWLPGVSFLGVTLLMAALVFLLIVFSPYLCRALHLNGEASVFLSIITLAVIVAAALFAPQSHVVTEVMVDTPGLLRQAAILLLILFVGLFVGYMIFRFLASKSR